MMRSTFFLAALLYAVALVLLISGCGGGGSEAKVVPATMTRVAVAINWGVRSRVIAVPASALSVVVVLRGANPDGSDFAFTINRGDNPAAFTQTYTSQTETRAGTWEMQVRCHAEPEGSGALVGTAAVSAAVSSTVVSATVTTEGTIATVEMVAGQTVLVGEQKALAFTARNAAGEVVAVTPGSAQFTVTDGDAHLRIREGHAEGLAPGDAHVTAHVDGRTSAPAEVHVTSHVTVTVHPETLTLPVDASETFTATVSGTDDKRVLWSIAEGTAGGTITDGGRYTAPHTPGTYHVVATSVYDPSKHGTATVTVTSHPDGGTDHIHLVTLATNDLEYDPVSHRIWASVPARESHDRANTVTAIDPVTATIGDSFPVGPEPDKLALRGEAQILWVGINGEAAVRRFNLASKTTGNFIGLGQDGDHGAFIAEDIEVQPGHPETIAVARRNREHSPRHEGVVVYDDGIARAKSTDRHLGSTALTFSSHSEKLYGFNNEPGDELGFRRMELAHDGVLVASNTRGLLEGVGADIVFDDGRLYCSTGRVINPEERTVLGTFPEVGHGALVLPDSAKGHVYFLTGDGTTRRLQVYDRNTYSQVAVLEITGVHGTPSSLIRWGEHGLAFRTNDNQVFLIDSIPGL